MAVTRPGPARVLAALALALSGAAARAQPIDALQVRSWAAACANCHGTQGKAQPGMASLAGMGREKMVRKMQDFRNGRTAATVMHQLSQGYSDEQIAAIAAYFQARKP